jgi:ankyrin repeat protein
MDAQEINEMLREACKRCDYEEFRRQISLGARVAATDTDSLNSLHCLALSSTIRHADSSTEIAQLILDVDGALVNARDWWGRTPLRYSTHNSNVALSKVLLRGGADANIRDYIGESAMHSACYHGPLELVLLLIAGGGNVHIKNHSGVTPLDLCVQGPVRLSRCAVEAAFVREQKSRNTTRRWLEKRSKSFRVYNSAAVRALRKLLSPDSR